MTTTPITPLNYTASTCNRCGVVQNRIHFKDACPTCRSTSGCTTITIAPSFGIHS